MNMISLVPLTLVPLARLPMPGAEIPAFDRVSGRLFVTSASDVHAFDLDAGGVPRGLGFARLGEIGDDVTHVAIDPAGRGFVAACVVPEQFASRHGHVVFLNPLTLREVGRVATGHNPDSCAFSPGGEFLVVANEGQPQTLPSGEIIDPPGSVTVIDLRRVRSAADLSALGESAATTLVLSGGVLDAALGSDRPPRIAARQSESPALDLEPEYAVAPSNQWAYVSLQENNAIAKIALDPPRVDAIVGLGLVRREIDPSDRDGTKAPRWEVTGAPMPDQIAVASVGGARYLIAAEEGDDRAAVREKGLRGTQDIGRIGDLLAWGEIDPGLLVPGAESADRLGRLHVLIDEAVRGDGLVMPGTRSIGLYSLETLERVGDTGSSIEIATLSLFSDDSRSDDRGPEPEGVIVTEIGGRNLVLASIERPGAIAAIDIEKPEAPKLDWIYPSAWDGDLGPEGMCLIDRSDGRTLLAVCYETSGTMVVYELRRTRGE